MTTLLDQLQVLRSTTLSTTHPATSPSHPTRVRADGSPGTFQAQQESRSPGQPAGQDASVRQVETFTVTCDEWFKA